MRTEISPEQTPTRLADYQPPEWMIDSVKLVFDFCDPRAHDHSVPTQWVGPSRSGSARQEIDSG